MCLSKLVEISNYYGRNPEYVLAGGGNTSYKDENYLYIKGSGTSLADITADGFVKMSRDRLAAIWSSSYSADEAEREAQVLALLMSSREGETGRPSVETSLHDLFGERYVVHTHPAIVNGLTCSAEGETAAQRLFGGDVMWMPPAKPGYILARDVKEGLESRRVRGGRTDMVLLANHGIFIAGDTPEEIIEKTEYIVGRIKENVKRTPDMSPVVMEEAEEYAEKLARGRHVRFGCTKDMLDFLSDGERFNKVCSAFTPDHMVYYKQEAMFFDGSPENTDAIAEEERRFEEERGFAPRIIAVKDYGAFAVGGTAREAEAALELFFDTIRIAVYAESFGGGQFMPGWLIDFISNWEVESYRKSKSV